MKHFKVLNMFIAIVFLAYKDALECALFYLRELITNVLDFSDFLTLH